MVTKLIIAGGRDFNDYPLLESRLRMYYGGEDLEIVSGVARGADSLGEQFATEYGFPITRFPADWNTHGKKAGFLRNKQMADYADALVAFWDGESRGTKHMIDSMAALDKDYHIIFYEQD